MIKKIMTVNNPAYDIAMITNCKSIAKTEKS